MGTLREASLMALLSMMVPLAPMVMGVTYAIWPTEGRLTLMRPLSLAGIFAALGGFFIGVINILVGLSRSPTALADNRVMFIGLAESMVPLVVGFGCLTVGWLCVTLGLRRQAP